MRSYIAIDPTIWQKFSDSESILVGVEESLESVVKLLEVKYGGVWIFSESINKCDNEYKDELLKVIESNKI